MAVEDEFPGALIVSDVRVVFHTTKRSAARRGSSRSR
jgi:hypothetical protein